MTKNVAQRALAQDLFFLKRDINAQLYCILLYSIVFDYMQIFIFLKSTHLIFLFIIEYDNISWRPTSTHDTPRPLRALPIPKPQDWWHKLVRILSLRKQ